MKSETGFDHALYDRFPTQEKRPEGELEELQRVWAAPKGLRLLKAVNNNYIGLFYIGAALLFFLLAGVLALLMRTQLLLPMNDFLDENLYNQIFTMHGTVMMFLFAVPAVEAIGILLLPQMLGARDLPFPRLSAYAFWAYFVGGLAFFCSLFFGLAPKGGWFMYPPLTGAVHSPGINADFWLLGIGFIEISAIAGAIEIVVGVLRNRAPGMSLDKLPIFAWAMLVFAIMIIFAFPSIILATLLLELERALNWPFFDSLRGGDPILWQHLFWFFGHPDVYIIFLPAAGMVSMIAPTIVRKPLVAFEFVALAVLATGFLSFGVWVHHMFATGLPPVSTAFFSAAGMAVSIPAGIQVFAWIGTLSAGKVKWSVPAYFIVGSIVIFIMGGLTGVMLSLVPFDWVAHDTYFVVAHLHYVLIGGMLFPLIAALYYWTPISSRNRLSEKLGKCAFWLIFIGVHTTFLVMHWTGLMGMPRRVWTYVVDDWTLPNQISTIGAYMIGAGVLVVIVDFARNFRFAISKNAGNVYGGGTLEWLPTDLYSVRSIPFVKSRYPLWDDPDLSKNVDRGGYFLPNTATGARETLVTSAVNAEPQYLQRMPDPSWLPFGAAIFTAAFFLLLTVKLYPVALLSGALAIGFILCWAWKTDRPITPDSVDIGAGIFVPTYMRGRKSHGFWAALVVLIVAGMVFAMLIVSYVFLWSRNLQAWPAPPGVGQTAIVMTLALVAGGLAYAAGKRASRAPKGAVMLIWGAAASLAASFGVDALGWRGRGLDPQFFSHDALVASFLCWQAQFVAISLIMAIYAAVRGWRGLLDAKRPMTLEIIGVFLLYSAAQAFVAAGVTRLYPLAA